MSSADPRDTIASIDTQILDLLRERCRAMMENTVSNPNPDWASTLASIDHVVDRSVQSGSGNEDSNAAVPDSEVQRNILRHVASACWRATRPGTYAFLGPPDSYSHLAALAYFGDAANLLPVSSIGAVFDAVGRGDCAGGIVPIENSTDGRVVDTFGRLSKGEVSITGEVQLAIHHQLLAMCDRDSITEVHSKPQAISQFNRGRRETGRDPNWRRCNRQRSRRPAPWTSCHRRQHRRQPRQRDPIRGTRPRTTGPHRPRQNDATVSSCPPTRRIGRCDGHLQTTRAEPDLDRVVPSTRHQERILLRR